MAFPTEASASAAVLSRVETRILDTFSLRGMGEARPGTFRQAFAARPSAPLLVLATRNLRLGGILALVSE